MSVLVAIPDHYLNRNYAGLSFEVINRDAATPGHSAKWHVVPDGICLDAFTVVLNLDNAEAYALSLLAAVHLQRNPDALPERGPRLPHTHDPDGDGTDDCAACTVEDEAAAKRREDRA